MNDNYEEKHLFCIYLNSQCAATENIYTPPHRRNLNLSGVGGGGVGLRQNPFSGNVWIFSGTTNASLVFSYLTPNLLEIYPYIPD